MQRRNPYQPALEKAREDLARLDVHRVALRTGAQVAGGGDARVLALPYWGQQLQVRCDSGEVSATNGERVPVPVQLLVLHYLVTADGTPMADRWLSFRELEDGRVYDAAFRKRACIPLAQVFGTRPEELGPAARRLGGERLTYGDVSFMFRILPRARVAVILHAQDDEFPADANVLFDASMRQYLPIEDVAVLGGLVAIALIRARAATSH